MEVSFLRCICICFLLLVISSCSSRGAGEVGCNFSSGATLDVYDKENSWSSNLFNSAFLGLFNIALQGTHRVISPNTYDSCVKKDIATCIDANGDIKKECTLTQ
jgi:hypothetical protein